MNRIVATLALVLCLAGTARAQDDPAAALKARLAAHPELAFPTDWVHWITTDVALGARMEAVGYSTLTDRGITAVLSLQAEVEDDRKWFEEHKVTYKRIPVPDMTAPSMEQLRESVDWVREQVRAGKRVYVHCNGGRGRSANVVAAYLVTEHAWTAEQAWAYVEKQRPWVKRTPEQTAALERWAALEKARRIAKDRVVPKPTDKERTAERGIADLLERRVKERERSRDR